MTNNNKKYFKRKDIRLPPDEYETNAPVSLTICTSEKHAYLDDKWTRRLVLGSLIEVAGECEYSLLAYILMPDHLHMVVEKLGGTQLSSFIGKFKQETGYRFNQDRGGKLWQKSFYDHIIREEENLKSEVYHILNNPVRKGIVEDWEDYAYCGGELVDKLRYE